MDITTRTQMLALPVSTPKKDNKKIQSGYFQSHNLYWTWYRFKASYPTALLVSRTILYDTGEGMMREKSEVQRNSAS